MQLFYESPALAKPFTMRGKPRRGREEPSAAHVMSEKGTGAVRLPIARYSSRVDKAGLSHNEGSDVHVGKFILSFKSMFAYLTTVRIEAHVIFTNLISVILRD